MPSFDIILPTYNNCKDLKTCLESIKSQTFTDYKVWICVDGSTDETVDFLHKFCAEHIKFSYLEHKDRQNHGRAINRNQALPHLSAPYVLFVDGDVTCAPDLVMQHYMVLQKHPQGVSLGYTHWVNRKQNLWAKYISTRGVAKHKDGDVVPYQYFTTQNVAMKTSFVAALKGFDPYFTKYGGEDTEFAYRLQQAYDPTFVFCKTASVYTEADKSLENALDLLETFGKYNLKYIAQKHPDCGEIFYLDLLKGAGLKSILFKFLLNCSIYNLVVKSIKYMPAVLSPIFINFCIAYRIKKGFNS